MTIRSHINPRELSQALELQSPDNAAVGVIGEFADSIVRTVSALGLVAPNCDQIREVESVIFGYVRDANPGYFVEPASAPQVCAHPDGCVNAPASGDIFCAGCRSAMEARLEAKTD